MGKKLPLGIKVLIAFLLLTVIANIFTISRFILWAITKEPTPYNIGYFIGALIIPIFVMLLNLAAAIGLLRFKRWGIYLTLITLMLGALGFSSGFAGGLTEVMKGNSMHFIISFLISLAIAGIIIFKIKKYLLKDSIKFLYD